MSQLDKYLNPIIRPLETFLKPQGLKILSLIGLLYVTTKTISSIYSFSRTFLTIPYDLSKRYGPGSWALITGAAQGIGAAFSHQLAEKGFNLILIDIKEEQLGKTSESIKAKFPSVQVKTITCDFSKSMLPGFFDEVLQQVEGIDISILINNVGVGNPHAVFYNAQENAIFNTMVVNMVPVTMLMKKLIPKMLERPNRSAIINISSIAGIYPIPRIPLYSATKAYIDFLTRALEVNLRNKIDMLSVRPDAVSTAMTLSPAVGSYVISPESLAKGALAKLGKVPFAHGHWRHEIKVWLTNNDLMRDLAIRHYFTRVIGIPYKK